MHSASPPPWVAKVKLFLGYPYLSGQADAEVVQITNEFLRQVSLPWKTDLLNTNEELTFFLLY